MARKFGVFIVSVAALACSPAEDGVGGSGGDGQMSGSDAGVGGSGAAGSPDVGGSGGSESSLCNADSPPERGTERCLIQVRGRAVDEAGEPIVGEVASVCGPICYYGETDSDGDFAATVGQYVELSEYSISVHGRPYRAIFYDRLPEPDEQGVAEVREQVSLGLPAAGAAFDRAGDSPEQVVESDDVELTIPEGVEVRLDPEDLLAAAEEGAQFRARRIPDDRLEHFLGEGTDAFAAYALGPFEAWFREQESGAQVSPQLSFPNDENLEPGSAVEVLALGTYVFPDWIEPAVFSPVATATVTDDGDRIELDAGQGIDYLTWVALRVAD